MAKNKNNNFKNSKNNASGSSKDSMTNSSRNDAGSSSRNQGSMKDSHAQVPDKGASRSGPGGE